jgi:hypothetical protein
LTQRRGAGGVMRAGLTNLMVFTEIHRGFGLNRIQKSDGFTVHKFKFSKIIKKIKKNTVKTRANSKHSSEENFPHQHRLDD